MKLTEHFTLEELTKSDIAIQHSIDNTAPLDVIPNLTRLANVLEQIRALIAKPIIVTSAYRNLKVNAMLDSKPTSQHCIGCAADIKVSGMTPNDIVNRIVNSKIDYDQVIREFDSWVHISIPNDEKTKPRKQALIIDRSGTRPYMSKLDNTVFAI